jgi:hypothetical protein
MQRNAGKHRLPLKSEPKRLNSKKHPDRNPGVLHLGPDRAPGVYFFKVKFLGKS